MSRIRLASSVVVAVLAVALVWAAVAIAGSRASTATSVTVTMKEFKFILSRKTVPHGKVTFTLVNKGALAHDFKIGTKKSALIAAGKRGKLIVTLAKGNRPYKCTVPGHAAAGMKGVLKVT